MHSKVLIVFFGILFGLVYSNKDDDEIKNLSEYLTKFDSVDVDTILKNDRLFFAYFNCFMEKGPCTAEARAIRKAIPAIQKTHCNQCTEDQKTRLRKSFNYIKDNRPKQWNEVVQKYDPKMEAVNAFLNTA